MHCHFSRYSCKSCVLNMFENKGYCSDFRYESNGIFVLGVSFCSDFRYESNGIFVLGVDFFLQTNFDFLTSHF